MLDYRFGSVLLHMGFLCTACSGILLKSHPILVYFLICNALLSQSELEVLTRKPVCFIIFGKPVSQDSRHVWKLCSSVCFLIFINQLFLSRELGRPPSQNV